MATMTLRRRALPLLALAAVGAPAVANTLDLAVTCDTTLAPALRRIAAAYKTRSGAHVFVFPTGPGLILPQLMRQIQNDIVVTQTTILDQAAQTGIIASPVRAQWGNPLVIAGLRDTAPIDRIFAAPDPSLASDIDGPALLARLDIRPTLTMGAVDTDEVAFLIASGMAQAGLLHMTDIRANEGLVVIRPLPTEVQPPVRYAASVTRLASRPNPEGLVSFLASKDATEILAAAGLEAIT
jgi:molybdate transport system substrate-binding protein